MFDISPTEEVGDFEVKAKFMGVEMEKVKLHFQVNISSETLLHAIADVADLSLVLKNITLYLAGNQEGCCIDLLKVCINSVQINIKTVF